jgi:hypothetical protein
MKLETFFLVFCSAQISIHLILYNCNNIILLFRALAQLFDELRMQQDAEFSVRVSYLELYNEEIFDLLSATEDTTRLQLYEDSTKKGSVIIKVSTSSFVDPHHFDVNPDADPDSTYYSDADPVSAYYSDADRDADPDSDFLLMRIRIRLLTLMWIRIRIQILASK